MPITVGTLRTFCEERASPDSAGGTADREFMQWINSALVRLYKAAQWDRLIREEKRLIAPVETFTDVLGLTQGSRAITLSAGLFLAKYVTERWELRIEGYDKGTFELSAIGTPASTATMRTGDEWPGATTATETAQFLNTRLSLPLAKDVFRVRVVETGSPVTILTPVQFDKQRDLYPLGTTGDPRFCTFRRGNLEFWPHPGTVYRKLSISYHLSFTRIDDDEDDATEVEWDVEQQDLLEKAILLEAAITQGEAAVVPYVVAEREFMNALHTDKEFMQRNNLTGPMALQMPNVRPYPYRGGLSVNTQAGDDV
jgi:hypothetical protein